MTSGPWAANSGAMDPILAAPVVSYQGRDHDNREANVITTREMSGLKQIGQNLERRSRVRAAGGNNIFSDPLILFWHPSRDAAASGMRDPESLVIIAAVA